jgi:AhpD family alkylhydroperoxidase
MPAKNYPERFDHMNELMGKLAQQSPAVMGGFQQLHKAGVADGALDVKTKELIALAIAITVRCDGCIAFHVHDALKAGATKEEIADTIGVAVLMGGGPSVMYGCEALEAAEQFIESYRPDVHPAQ